jgi:2-keto-4-pentenoate hydratase/2-oxohepta-3-ene-1,7-dioic acid hydratase in catechol pathway
MLTPVLSLLVYISQFFTLLPGDMLLTGTPAGVGPLAVGDHLQLSLSGLIECETQICAAN